MGKISSRGQVAIPSDIRQQLNLQEGSKVLFFAEDDTLIIKKVTTKTFAEITNPLKEAVRKSSLREEDVPGIVHRARRQ